MDRQAELGELRPTCVLPSWGVGMNRDTLALFNLLLLQVEASACDVLLLSVCGAESN